MANEQQIDLLVEKVAETMYYQNVSSGFKWENEGQWFRDKYLGYAREVIFENDLALMVKTVRECADEDGVVMKYKEVSYIPLREVIE